MKTTSCDECCCYWSYFYICVILVEAAAALAATVTSPFLSFQIKFYQKQYTDLTSGRSCVFFFKAYEQNMREKLHLNIEMFISKHENGCYDKIQ